MKENEIKELLCKKRLSYVKSRSIWATIIPSMGAYQNGIGAIMHTMKDHILHFNRDGVVILAVDDMNGKLSEKHIIFIPNKNIRSIDIKIKMSKFLLTIQTKEGIIEYKVRKRILACPWHKENLSFLLLETV